MAFDVWPEIYGIFINESIVFVTKGSYVDCRCEFISFLTKAFQIYAAQN